MRIWIGNTEQNYSRRKYLPPQSITKPILTVFIFLIKNPPFFYLSNGVIGGVGVVVHNPDLQRFILQLQVVSLEPGARSHS